MNSDFRDLLQIFVEENVEFLIVGGYAVIHYSQPRYTKDLDLWIRPESANAARLMKSFARFGLPMLGLKKEDFATPGTQLSIGVAPSEIDLLTIIPGLEFSGCWERKTLSAEDGILVPYVSKADLLIAKRTAGRHQDLADIEELERGEDSDG